jgi:hypothetical protein
MRLLILTLALLGLFCALLMAMDGSWGWVAATLLTLGGLVACSYMEPPTK